MIFSSIYSKDDCSIYPEAIQKAIQYLKDNDFNKMEAGVYEIDGKKMYAQVFDATPKPKEEIRPEVHEKYLDVQYLASGKEGLGFCADEGKFEVDERIDERDLIFYKSMENEGFITAIPGCYSIFFPNDVHRPSILIDDYTSVRKVVVKVSLELL
ncbi:YhcH/YjgK/YiaL family protein [Anaerobium acetethylicum]|uniref:YhcH/YjgK/YiaL family protein n=1 Tax=Anaerobium acetethylicum TaxID=1619234 RepID=A0A1D3TYD4_9FIRM|nr:YhcH/YjgK/YiaL family protein [Anaerobium acetethylicum]SCP99439.1 YhcH/YjgK/YiaL family protein [Anaerobium acetethylicum]